MGQIRRMTCVAGLLCIAAAALPVNPVLRAIPDSTWFQIPGSGTDLGQDMIIESCVSYDPGRNRVLVYGGGHATMGFENHILVYDLNTLEWSRPYEPDSCGAYAGTESTGITASGKPWVTHTYDHHDFVEHTGKLFYFQGTSGAWMQECVLGYVFCRNTWMFDFDSNQWQLQAVTGTVPVANYDGGSVTSCVTAYDNVTRKVYVARQTKTYIFDPDSKIWETVVATGSVGSSIENNMAAAPDQGKLVAYGGNYPANADTRVYDIASRTWTLMSPAQNPGQRKEIAMTYDTLHKRIAVYGGYNGGTDSLVWFYDIQADRWEGVAGRNAPSKYYAGLNYDRTNNVFVSVRQIGYSGLEVWAFKLNDQGFTGDAAAAQGPLLQSAGHPMLETSPNPFRSAVRITGAGASAIDVFNALGRRVARLRAGETLWNSGNLPAGVYVARSINGIRKVILKIR